MIYSKNQQNNLFFVQLHYDELDHIYRQIWGEHLHHGLWRSGDETPQEAVENLLYLVAESARLTSGMSVCDIGCGYGGTSRFLMKNHHVDVTGFTISPAQYDYAVSLLDTSNNPKYLLCDFLKNSLPPEQFDVAISIESSEHMADKRFFFHEVYRILKSKGKMVVCAWLARDKPKHWESRFLIEPICREGRLPSLGSENDYRQFMADAGFRNIQCIPLTNQVKKTWNICIKRVCKAIVSDLEFLKTALNPHFQNRAFLKTIFRIWAAYRIGSMEYSLFVAEKLSHH